MKLRILLFSLALLCACGTAAAQTFRVKVVRISDGDTFTGLNRDNLQLRFRLLGIDTPEKNQAFGTKARTRLSDLIFGDTITVDVRKTDGYGRFLAYARTTDGRDVSLELLREGLAWHYTQYDSSETYRAAEAEAREHRRGLWADPAPVAPWEFRKQKRR